MILLVDKIEKSFGARVLFSGASFQINPGERFALVGPNGAGKTTMLKIIMGIDSPDAGQVQYAKDCQVGYLEQETNLEHKDTAILAEVMAAAKEIRRMGERANELQAQITELSEQGKDVDALLNEYGQVQDRFERLGGYELESNARKILSGLGFKVTDFERPCSEFSGGWQMRIALAKLFLRHPDLLLLDEPTKGVDAFAREQIALLLEQLRAFVELKSAFFGNGKDRGARLVGNVRLVVEHARNGPERIAAQSCQIFDRHSCLLPLG